MRVMVLGGTGFIGRNVAAALRERGHSVLIGSRNPRRALKKLPPELRAHFHDTDLRETHLEFLTTCYAWKPLLAGVDVVVNAVGILRERGRETYDRVHNMAPTALAAACERMHLRLVHVSALGLRRQALSRFIHSKILAERAIAAGGADYSIVRPSLLDGEGGFGAEWVRRVARWPVHFIPDEALGRMAPMDVRDLGEAIAVLCEMRARTDWREAELGGSAKRTMAEYLASMRALHDDRPALRIGIPRFLARITAHVCDLLHFSPFSFGHLELLRRDNAPAVNLLPLLLGRAPRIVGRELPASLPAARPASRPAYAPGLTFFGRIRELLH